MSIENKSGAGLSAALEEAQSIIKAAEQRAESLLMQAELSFKESTEKGYAVGFEQGKKDAAKQAVRLIEESAQISEKLSEQAARLALAIAETIIHKSVELDPEAATQIAKNALQEAVVGQNVILVVHPEDLEAVNNSTQELGKIAGGASVAIETDESFVRGSCLVRTDFGEVDATVPTLIESIAERLEIKSNE